MSGAKPADPHLVAMATLMGEMMDAATATTLGVIEAELHALHGVLPGAAPHKAPADVDAETEAGFDNFPV